MKYKEKEVYVDPIKYKYVGKIMCCRSNYIFKIIGAINSGNGHGNRYLVTFDLDMTLDNMNEDYVKDYAISSIVEGSIRPNFPPGYNRLRNEQKFVFRPMDIEAVCKRTWRSLINKHTGEEWLNSYDSFKKWYLGEMPSDEFNPHLNIDKDALQCRIPKESRIYSPDKCVLITGSLNVIMSLQNHRGNHIPVGIREISYGGEEPSYQVFCQGVSPNCTSSRSFKNMLEAFIFFKMLKEYKLIYEAKEAYNKCKINKRAYDALNKFVVIDPNKIIKDSDVMKWLYDRYPYPTYRSYYELRELYFKEFDIEKLMNKRRTHEVRFS